MDDRSAELLTKLIQEYIQKGQPVGSKLLASYFSLSSATIRNVMSDLERLGLIHSPHTSAGRIPTPKGYSYFVNNLLTSKQNFYDSHEVIEEAFSAASSSSLPELMESAAGILSKLTHFAGVVVVPNREMHFKHIEFVRLSGSSVLMILVSPQGEVFNIILNVDTNISDKSLHQAASYLNSNYAGLPLSEVRVEISNQLSELKIDISQLMQSSIDSVGSRSESEVKISGQGKLLDSEDLASDLTKLKKTFTLFEQKSELAHILDLASHSQGVQIYIGGESPYVPFQDLSIVASSYQSNGKIIGALGVIGPSRMAYDRVIPIVDITAKLLSNTLST